MIAIFRQLGQEWQRSAGFWSFLLQPSVRLLLSWTVVLVMNGIGLHKSWHHLAKPDRADGNDGHAQIDFGGQWLMGRMLLEGYGKQLYHRELHRQVLEKGYPAEIKGGTQEQSDAELLLTWMMETENKKIGGPLYPPVHAFYYAPVALLPPQPAYRCFQVLNLVLILLCGLAVARLSQGMIWWPVATIFLMLYPGLGGALNLAQNPTISLTILLWGWVALGSGRPVLAGILWGFLAFKPVWAVTFCLVPLLTRRWKMLVAMMLTGGCLALVTLPFVGIQTWLDWMAVGRVAAETYNVDKNWINMSRDLLGLARRWLVDFKLPLAERNIQWMAPTFLGWGLLLFFLEVTTRLSVLRSDSVRRIDGPAPAFLILGAWFCCYHFMYYDALLTAFPVCLLLLALYRELWQHWQQVRAGRSRFWTGRALWHLVAVVLIVAIVVMNHVEWYLFHSRDLGRMMIPYEQFGLMALWAWCGITWKAEKTGRQKKRRGR